MLLSDSSGQYNEGGTPLIPLLLCIAYPLFFCAILALALYKVWRAHRDVAQLDDESKVPPGRNRVLQCFIVLTTCIVTMFCIIFWVGAGRFYATITALEDDTDMEEIPYLGDATLAVFYFFYAIPLGIASTSLLLMLSSFHDVLRCTIGGRCCMICFVPFIQVGNMAAFGATWFVVSKVFTLLSDVDRGLSAPCRFLNDHTIIPSEITRILCLRLQYGLHLTIVASAFLIFGSGIVFITSCAGGFCIQRMFRRPRGYQHLHVQHHVHYGSGDHRPLAQR